LIINSKLERAVIESILLKILHEKYVYAGCGDAIPALGRLRKEHLKFKSILGYIETLSEK
jgi:hypothetical protein